MAKTIPAAAAKAQFSEALRDAESGEQVIITRYGKPVAVLVHPELMAQLERLQALDEGGGLSSVVGRYADADDFLEALEQVERVAEGRALPEFE